MIAHQDTGEPELYFVKLPEDIHNRFVLLLDPILASGSHQHPPFGSRVSSVLVPHLTVGVALRQAEAPSERSKCC
jgi:hypothetical protein